MPAYAPARPHSIAARSASRAGNRGCRASKYSCQTFRVSGSFQTWCRVARISSCKLQADVGCAATTSSKPKDCPATASAANRRVTSPTNREGSVSLSANTLKTNSSVAIPAASAKAKSAAAARSSAVRRETPTSLNVRRSRSSYSQLSRGGAGNSPSASPNTNTVRKLIPLPVSGVTTWTPASCRSSRVTAASASNCRNKSPISAIPGNSASSGPNPDNSCIASAAARSSFKHSSSARTSGRVSVPSCRYRFSVWETSSHNNSSRRRRAHSAQVAGLSHSCTRSRSSCHLSRQSSLVGQSSQFRSTSPNIEHSSSSPSQSNRCATYGDFRTAKNVMRLPRSRTNASQSKTSRGSDRSRIGKASARSTGIPLSENTARNREYTAGSWVTTATERGSASRSSSNALIWSATTHSSRPRLGQDKIRIPSASPARTG